MMTMDGPHDSRFASPAVCVDSAVTFASFTMMIDVVWRGKDNSHRQRQILNVFESLKHLGRKVVGEKGKFSSRQILNFINTCMYGLVFEIMKKLKNKTNKKIIEDHVWIV